ncbi:MAG: ribosome biogenesis GTP-binding protein YihA/YsxC [Erysipelotrichaceae bacterium]
MIAFSNVEFLTSALNKKGWPDCNLPEILMVGRSNVGKSSTINSLLNNKKVAYVGKRPGKTRLLNFFAIDDKVILVDAPGYGFANRNYTELINYGKMMDEYLLENKNLKLVIWILDIRRTPNEDDLLMFDWIINSKIPYLLLLNKVDKLSGNKRVKQIKLISEKLKLKSEDYLEYSAQTHKNREALKNIFESII